MKVYQVKFKAYFESDKYVYFLAENFDEAEKLAEKFRQKRVETEGAATIVGLSEQFEISVI